MERVLVYQVSALLMFGMASIGLMLTRHLIRKVIALNVMATSVFLVLVSLSYRPGETTSDPVPQALVLTGIVVSFCATALAVGMARRIHDHTGQSHLPEEGTERSIRDEP